MPNGTSAAAPSAGSVRPECFSFASGWWVKIWGSGERGDGSMRKFIVSLVVAVVGVGVAGR